MKAHKILKKGIILLLISWLFIMEDAYAATWNGGFTAGASSGCSGTGRYFHFNHDGACTGTYNMTFSLQRNAGSGYTTITTLTKVSNLSSGAGDQMYFPASAIDKSGNYRVIVSGVNALGSSCDISIGSYTSDPIPITVIPTPNVLFKINDVERYTFLPGYITVPSCAPIKLSYKGSEEVTSYRYSIKTVTSTGTPIAGHSYVGPMVSGSPSTISFSLFPSAYYEVTLEVFNGSCTSSRTSRIYTSPTAPPATVGFKVNNIGLTSDCATGFIPIAYRCGTDAITLNNYSSNVSEYQIKLERRSTSCGVYALVYTSDYLTSLPTDLKNLPGTNGTTLQNNDGYYRITISGKNACGIMESTAVGYIQILLEPNPFIEIRINGRILPTNSTDVLPNFFRHSLTFLH